MSANRRLRWLLGALVVAVIALVVARFGGGPPPAAAGRQPPVQPAAPAASAPTEPAPANVNLQALGATREAPTEAGRDPFRFRPRPAAPPPVAQRIPGIADDQVGAPPAPRVPAGPPPPPPITLKFIGIVEKADGTKIAILSDGKRPISGTEGDEIEGRYKILKIGQEALEIAYIDGRGRQTIPLTGQ
jgi:hypothetical protein